MSNALTTLSSIGVMFILMAVGFVMAKKGVLSKSGKQQLSTIVLKLVFPVLIFMAFQKDNNPELISGLLWSFLLSFISVIVGIVIAAIVIPKKHIDCAIERFSIIYSNCAFIGIPLVSGIFGSEGVLYVTTYITFFNLFVWSHGVMMLKNEMSFSGLLKTLRSPTIISVFIGIICFFVGIKVPKVPADAMNYISSLNTPLAMFIAGATVAEADLKQTIKKPAVLLTCFHKLILLPIIVLLIFKLLPVPSETAFTTIMIATACPTATIGTLFAIEYKKNDVYASEIFALSTLLSGITVPLTVILSGFVYNL